MGKCGILCNLLDVVHVQTFLTAPSRAEPSLLLAVSGGIDSMVMLYAVHELAKKYALKLFVITVNHNLRPANETEGDALFVSTYCRDELNIPCCVQTVPLGKIASLVAERSRGVEEAARYIRYELIKEQAKECGADFVLFAHNRDDQLETLLQHFLQGAAAGISGTASAGMQSIVVLPFQSSVAHNREENQSQHEDQDSVLLVRPLLDCARSEIEAYANEQKVPFREDSTNAEAVYYRNKLRHKLIPLLDENFPGWDTGVLAGAEKALEESRFVEKLASFVQWEKTDPVRVKLDDFFAVDFPVRVRSLYEGFSLAGIEGRISYKIVKAAALGQKRVQGAGFEIVQHKNYLIIRKTGNSKPQTQDDNHCTDLYTIEVLECGEYSAWDGTFVVSKDVQKRVLSADNRLEMDSIGPFFLPLYIRSKKSGDTILTALGRHKSLKKIWNEWQVQFGHRQFLPIIEQDGQAMCIWGSLYGYPNWYVKQKNNTKRQSVFVYFIRNVV